SCSEFVSLRFSPLPGASQEVGIVAALWRSATRTRGDALGDTTAASGPIDELLGADATETAFALGSRGRSVIHIATHAFFTGGECDAAGSERGIGGMAAAASAPVSRPFENPLLFSGLVLAGANHRDQAPAAGDDGILTAEEIAALDLSGTQWAVLSGCETGVGQAVPGEGVLGLQRAFVLAGVRTLIMSLWGVDDRASRDWMRRLYQARLERGLSAAAAVREASLATLHERRARGSSTHPFFWGPFVESGDWR